VNADKLAANEALFRNVNERIWETDARFGAPGEESGRYLEFLCECGMLDCVEKIELTAPEYESVRAEPDHFALAPGHDDGSVESVLLETERFVIVEKFVAEGLLESTDPRS
jgi:hypothetical protein